jgi:hypothetical protein
MTHDPLLLKEQRRMLVMLQRKGGNNILTLVSGVSVDLQGLGSLLLKAVGLHLLFSLNDKL